MECRFWKLCGRNFQLEKLALVKNKRERERQRERKKLTTFSLFQLGCLGVCPAARGMCNLFSMVHLPHSDTIVPSHLVRFIRLILPRIGVFVVFIVFLFFFHDRYSFINYIDFFFFFRNSPRNFLRLWKIHDIDSSLWIIFARNK